MATTGDELAPFDRTSIALHATIERLSPGSALPPDLFAQVLKRNGTRLVDGLARYGPPSTASEKRLKPESGKITSGGRERAISEAERAFVVRFSECVGLDQWQAYELLQNYLRDEQRAGVFAFDDRHIEQLAEYYADDRVATLRCASSVLRHAEDDAHPYAAALRKCADTLTEGDGIVTSVVKQLRSVSEAVRRLLVPEARPDKGTAKDAAGKAPAAGATDKPGERGKEVPAIPAPALISRDRRLSWRLVEQAELLEILFMAFYARVRCDAARFVELAGLFASSCFGDTPGLPAEQSPGGDPGLALGPALTALARRCAHLCVIVLVECLALEDVATPLHANPHASLSGTAMEMEQAGHPFVGSEAAVKDVDAALARWGDRAAHGPVLLGWATLRLVHAAGFEAGDTDAARAFAARSGASGGNPLDYLARDVLGSEAFGPDADSSLAYRSVVKGFLTALTVAFHPDSVDLDGCVGLATAVYCGHPQLCAQFWQHEAPSPQLRALLDAAVEAFPARPRPLLALLTALASDADGAIHCAAVTFDLPTIAVPLTDEVRYRVEVIRGEEGEELLCNRRGPIFACGSARMEVPMESVGQVSPRDPNMAIWAVRWSAWRLFMATLDEFASSAVVDVAGRLAVPESGNPLASLDGVAAVLELVGNSPHTPWCLLMVPPSALLLQLVAAAMLERSGEAAREVEHHVAGYADDMREARPDGLLQRALRVLQRCVLARDLPGRVLTAALRCVGGVAHARPYEAWSGLVRCGFFPAPGTGMLPAPGAPAAVAQWASPLGALPAALSAAGGGHMRNVLHGIECARGTYGATLSFLGILSVLVGRAQTIGATEGNSDVEMAFMRHFLSDLGSSISFVVGDVFVGHDSWRYQRVLDRFAIGLRCLSLFDAILSSWRDPSARPADAPRTIAHLLAAALASDPVLIAPLLRALAIGTGRLDRLWLSRRVREARMAERLVLAAARVVSRLLDGRAMLQAGQAAPVPTPLDVALFHWTESADGQRPLIYVVAEYVLYSRDPGLVVAGVGIVRRLCAASALWHPRPPSMLGYFGESDDILRNAYARRLLGKRADADTKVAILRMMAVAIETQPGLAARFLDIDTKPPVGTKAAADAPRPAPRLGPHSCLRLVADVFANHARELDWRPRLFVAVMGVVRALWDRRGMYAEALAALCRTPDFWEHMVRLACLPVAAEGPLEGDRPTDAVAKAHRMVVRGCALHIVATELLSSGADASLLAAARRHLSVPGTAAKWLAVSPVHREMQGLLDSVRRSVAAVAPAVSLDALRNPEGLGDGTHLGPFYLYDAERLGLMLLGGAWRAHVREASSAGDYTAPLDVEMMVAEDDAAAALEGSTSVSFATATGAYGADAAADISRAESAAFGVFRAVDVTMGDMDPDRSLAARESAALVVAELMQANAEWSLSDASLFVLGAWRALFGVLCTRRPSVLGAEELEDKGKSAGTEKAASKPDSTAGKADLAGKAGKEGDEKDGSKEAPKEKEKEKEKAADRPTASSGGASAVYAALHAAAVGLEDCVSSAGGYAAARAANELAAIVAQLCSLWLATRERPPTHAQLSSIVGRLVRAGRAAAIGEAVVGDMERALHATLALLLRRMRPPMPAPVGELIRRGDDGAAQREETARAHEETMLLLVEQLAATLGRALSSYERDSPPMAGSDPAAESASLALVVLCEAARHLRQTNTAWKMAFARNGLFVRLLAALPVAAARATPVDGRFLEAALVFLASAIETHQAADALAAAGLGDAVCAVAGGLFAECFATAEDAAPAAYVLGAASDQRSVWHRCWCHVLSVAAAALAALGRAEGCLDWCIALCALAEDRIIASFGAIAADDGVIGMRTPRGSGLSLAAIDEARCAAGLLAALARFVGAWRFATPETAARLVWQLALLVESSASLLECEDAPDRLRQALRPPTRGEREEAMSAVPPSTTPVKLAPGDAADARVLALAESHLYALLYNAIGCVRRLMPNPLAPSHGTDWDAARPLFAPYLSSQSASEPTMGALVSCMSACESSMRRYLDARRATKTRSTDEDDGHVRTVLFVAEGALVSALSHATFFLTQPGGSERHEGLRKDLTNSLSRFLESASKFFQQRGGGAGSVLATPTASPFGARHAGTPPMSPGGPGAAPRLRFGRGADQVVFMLADAYVRRTLRHSAM